jgi:transposase
MEYNNRSVITTDMKPYSIDFREKIVKAYEQDNTSVRKVAERFNVSKGFVQKMLKQRKLEGHLRPGKQGGAMKSELADQHPKLMVMVEQHPDATLAEYCEYWRETYQQWISISSMCRELKKLQLTRKKKRSAAVKPLVNGCTSLEVTTGSALNE